MMTRTALPLLLCLVFALPAIAQDRPRTQRRITYAELDRGRELQLDLYLPRDVEDAPLVVWVHGGGWMAGHRYPCPLHYLTEEGFAVASISYRFAQEASYPAQLHDCKAAIRFLRANSDEYGYDAEHIGACGASAGGHLVALLGTTGNTDDPDVEGDLGDHLETSSEVQAVCDLFGPTDLMAFVSDTPRGQAALSMVTFLLGGDPEDEPELARAADPVTYLDSDDPPVIIAHSDRDELVPLSQSEYFDAALEEAGVEHELIVVEGAGHGTPEFGTDEMQQRLTDFFDKHLRGEDE